MSLVSVNWNPSSKELNGFRVISVIACVLLAVVFYVFRGTDLRWCVAIVGAGAGIALSGFISLRLTQCIYVGMVAVTLPIGFVVSLTLMAIVYFGLITPLGLIFRLMGRDSLCRRFDPKTKSYWVAHQQTTQVDRYFQQF